MSNVLAFPYQPIAPAPQEPNLAVQGRTVFVRSPAGVPTGVFAYSLDGGEPRRFLAKEGTQNLDGIETSPQALALLTTSGPPDRVLYGPLNGPLKPLNKHVLNVGLSGSTMLSLEGFTPSNRSSPATSTAAPPRRIAGPSRDLRYLRAAGPYVSVSNDKGRIIVLNWRTKREVYRVHPSGSPAYVLSADGRIVTRDGEFERIQTASPANPHLHTIARVNSAPYSLAIAGTRIVFEEILSRSTGRLVVLRPEREAPRDLTADAAGRVRDGLRWAQRCLRQRHVRLRRPGPGDDAHGPATALLITGTRAGRRRP